MQIFTFKYPGGRFSVISGIGSPLYSAWHIYSYHNDKIYCQFFPICLISTIVLEFDMQVKRHITAVYFMTIFIGTGEIFLYLNRKSSVFLSIFQFVEPVILFSEPLDYNDVDT